MKDHILNSSSQATITSKEAISRLYVVTGKGGVGKTTTAIALASSLQEKGYKVLYNSFDVSPKYESLNALGVPYFELVLEDSMVEYMGRKLKSEIVAKWIMKTPFFSSLLNMLPALSQMILLGHIIDKLRDDPQLHIVIDAPASGHSLTLFQSTHNFKDMFKEGLLVDDINKMHNFLHGENNLQVWIATLPTRMAIQEGKELGQELKGMGLDNVKYIANGFLADVPYIKEHPDKLPYFLEQKVNMEKEALVEISDESDELQVLPYFTDVKFDLVIKSAKGFLMENSKWI